MARVCRAVIATAAHTLLNIRQTMMLFDVYAIFRVPPLLRLRCLFFIDIFAFDALTRCFAAMLLLFAPCHERATLLVSCHLQDDIFLLLIHHAAAIC